MYVDFFSAFPFTPHRQFEFFQKKNRSSPFLELETAQAHRRDESWSASLWQTFFSTSMGAQIPMLAEKPLVSGGCKKFKVDALGDHLSTCTAHSGVKTQEGSRLDGWSTS
jgi:hypothetical protein